MIEVPPIVRDIRELGPTTLAELLGRHSQREVDVAVRKSLLRRYSMPGVALYDLGARGQRLVGLKHRKPRKPAGLIDGFALRLVIKHQVANGYAFEGFHPKNRHIALLRSERHLEYVVAKGNDFALLSARRLRADIQFEATMAGAVLVMMVRCERLARDLKREHAHMLEVRPFGDVLVGEPEAVVRLLTGTVT